MIPSRIFEGPSTADAAEVEGSSPVSRVSSAGAWREEVTRSFVLAEAGIYIVHKLAKCKKSNCLSDKAYPGVLTVERPSEDT